MFYVEKHGNNGGEVIVVFSKYCNFVLSKRAASGRGMSAAIDCFLFTPLL